MKKKMIVIALLSVMIAGGVLAGCGGNNPPQNDSGASESVVSGQTSEAGDEKLSKNQKAANSIMEKIDAIGDVTAEKADVIATARKAYNKASDDVKKLVTNFPTLKLAETKMEYMEKCEVYTYKEIMRNPDAYKGKYAKFDGQVAQVIEKDGQTDLIFTLFDGETENSSDDPTVYVSYTKWLDEVQITEGDYITLYGKLGGLHSYENLAMHMVSVPLLFAQAVEKQEA